MVVSSCTPSFHWERHQRLRSGWPSAWFYEIHPSLLPCFCVIAVSGSIVYMRATISLVALVSRSQWPISLTPSGSSSYVFYRYTSSWSVGYLHVVVLGGNFCHSLLYFGYLCRVLRMPAHTPVLHTEMDAYILLTLRIPALHADLRVSVCCPHLGASLSCWLLRLSCRRKLQRGHDRV